jgi:hypothetical protein
MAWSQADIDSLDNTIKSGTRSVRFADREIVNQPLADMLLARALAVEGFTAQNGGKLPNGQPLIRQHRFYTSKGF